MLLTCLPSVSASQDLPGNLLALWAARKWNRIPPRAGLTTTGDQPGRLPQLQRQTQRKRGRWCKRAQRFCLGRRYLAQRASAYDFIPRDAPRLAPFGVCSLRLSGEGRKRPTPAILSPAMGRHRPTPRRAIGIRTRSPEGRGPDCQAGLVLGSTCTTVPGIGAATSLMIPCSKSMRAKCSAKALYLSRSAAIATSASAASAISR